jgi:hypothetical protein
MRQQAAATRDECASEPQKFVAASVRFIQQSLVRGGPMAGTLFGIGSPAFSGTPGTWGVGQPLQAAPVQLQQLQTLQHYQLQQIQQLLQILPQQIQQLQQVIQFVPQQVAQLVQQVLQLHLAAGSGPGSSIGGGAWSPYLTGQVPLHTPVLGFPYQTMQTSPGASSLTGQPGYVM